MIEHVAARPGEHRPQEVARARPHGRESEPARAAHEPEEDRFRLVVTGVRERDPGGAFLVLDPAEEGVTLTASRVLQASSLRSPPGADVRARSAEGNGQGGAELTAEGGILGRVRPQGVIEMRRHHGEPALPAQAGQDVEKGHGIGPAGEAEDDTIARGRMPEPPQGLGDSGLESSTPQREGFLLRVGEMVAVQGLEPRTPRI